MTKYGVAASAGEVYRTRMPIYQDTLSDSEILPILSFIKSRWPRQVIQIHNEQVRRNNELFMTINTEPLVAVYRSAALFLIIELLALLGMPSIHASEGVLTD